MPSFIPPWDEIENWLTNTPFGIISLQIIVAIILVSFRALWNNFPAYIKARRADRLEVLRRRLDYFKRVKERPAKHFATLNVYGFLFLAFLVIRVSSSDLDLSVSEIFFVSIIMFYAFLIFARTGFLLMHPNFSIERAERKITKLEESTKNSDH